FLKARNSGPRPFAYREAARNAAALLSERKRRRSDGNSSGTIDSIAPTGPHRPFPPHGSGATACLDVSAPLAVRDMQLFDLPIERGESEAEQLGGLSLVVADAVQHVFDMDLLVGAHGFLQIVADDPYVARLARN